MFYLNIIKEYFNNIKNQKIFHLKSMKYFIRNSRILQQNIPKNVFYPNFRKITILEALKYFFKMMQEYFIGIL